MLRSGFNTREMPARLAFFLDSVSHKAYLEFIAVDALMGVVS
jgi:hypothetical protein